MGQERKGGSLRRTNIFGNGMPNEYRLPFPGVVGKKEPVNGSARKSPESKPRPMQGRGTIRGFQGPRH